MIPFDRIGDSLKAAGCPYREHVSLKPLTTFQIGGETPLLIEPETTASLSAALRLLKETDTPFFVMGNGSNLLISDDGVPYPIIRLSQGEFRAVKADGEKLICGAGALLISACRLACENALTGLEFAYGIPGSVGGAVYMNAGAYGGEIAQAVESVEYLTEDGSLRQIGADACAFRYRGSVFTGQKTVITRVVFRLSAGDRAAVSAAMEDFLARRKDKQPLDHPSAGSVFKRPPGQYAGALIEQAGLKGYAVGGARVSEKHAGFIVNMGDASCADVRQLIDIVRRTVYSASGVELEPEICFLQ